MTKTFKTLSASSSDALMVVDSLNLAFRYKHSRAVDFADDYMDTVQSLRRSYHCDKLVIAGDMGSSSYRKALSPIYKQNRKDKFAEQTEQEAAEFEAFFAEVQGILVRYEEEATYPLLRFPGVEADDIAAYIVSKRKQFNLSQIWLISSDRDWDLLVAQGVSRFSYVTRKEVTLDNWSTHYDFTQEEYISIKCLMGDSGDNVIGVPGIGPKKAAQLVLDYGSAYDIIDALPISSKYKYIANLNAFGGDNLLLNYQLMDLVTYCADAIGADNCKEIDTMLGLYL
nr:truncated DNA polymerase I [uncultured bacterium]ACL37077.1 truncated DNA polymerase I [uncultured bacterium]